ncbi:hypothetical protein X975_12709, partial [Stegodyphus mimosarum]
MVMSFVIAKHQTTVAMFLADRPRIIRFITWPVRTFHIRIVSNEPVTIICPS